VSLIIHVDGGSRGNPGPAGAGVVIRSDNGALVYEAGYFLGRQTNNAAEYHALIRALERAGQCGEHVITIHSDSELLVRQITGEYQVKSPTLAPLYRQVQTLLVRAGRWSLRHVRREQNTRADELANLAMDARRDVIVFDLGGSAERPAEVPVATDTASDATLAAPPPEGASGPARKAVRVTVNRPPQTSACPAGGLPEAAFTVGATLPAGLCVHAAHALVPTLLAILNTDAEEFAAVPTLTVRCGRPGCGAEFRLAPARSKNGAPRQPEK
jgi:ribonuclease HI